MNTKTRVTQEQRKVLLEFMMEHPDFAQGRVAGAAGARKKDRILKELACQLNSFDYGSTKTPEKWWKCWQDWRSDTKSKALRIKKYWEGQNTGGHMPAPLSKLEEILLEFSGVDPLMARQETDYASSFASEPPMEVLDTLDDWCKRIKSSGNVKDVQSGSEDEESLVLDPDSELWGFYDKQPHNKAKCSMCNERLKRDVDILYKHLKEKHSIISENLEYKDKDENFTEVIYLEEPLEPIRESKQDKVLIEVQPKAKKTSKRRYSTREDVKCNDSDKNLNKDEVEVDSFGKYITGLLKGLPRAAGTKLQMEIVSLIMNTKINLQTTPDLDSEVCERGKEIDPPDIEEENQENHEKLDTTTTDEDKQNHRPTKRPKRRISYREEYTYKNNLTESEEREIDNFGAYVTCLLKTVPQNKIGAKLQMNIVNLIMTARLQALQKNAPILTINGTIELDNTNVDQAMCTDN